MEDTARETAALIATLMGEIMEDAAADALDLRRLEAPAEAQFVGSLRDTAKDLVSLADALEVALRRSISPAPRR
jgi:hypothetical protein